MGALICCYLWSYAVGHLLGSIPVVIVCWKFDIPDVVAHPLWYTHQKFVDHSSIVDLSIFVGIFLHNMYYLFLSEMVLTVNSSSLPEVPSYEGLPRLYLACCYLFWITMHLVACFFRMSRSVAVSAVWYVPWCL